MTDTDNTQPKRQKKSAIMFIVIAMFAFILFNRSTPVETIDCTPEIISQKPDVIMLGAWWCSYCNDAKKYFKKKNIHYCEYDMESTATGKRLYEENGGGGIPLLLIGEYQLQGFNPRQIDAALAELYKAREKDGNKLEPAL